jgi:hypothetical protein
MEWMPLLKVQRDLLDLPRGQERFREYLKVVQGGAGREGLPLSAFNPMSKPHVAELLDALLAMDAEAIGAQAMHEAHARLPGVDEARVGLVLADDAKGGWTNRWLFEAKHLFEAKYDLGHGLVTVLLWSSEAADAAVVRIKVLAAIWRRAWMLRHGMPRTLGQCLLQEGLAAKFACSDVSRVTEAECAILREHLATEHFPTIVACLYGDEAAVECGYDPLGLPERAGLRFAAGDGFLGDRDATAMLIAR